MTAALLDRTLPRSPGTRSNGRPAPRSSGPTGRPRLQLLDQAARRRRTRRRSAVLVLFVAVLAGFFAVAFVHAELVAGQHDLDAVRTEIAEAGARHAELARAVETASAPAVIVGRATELGMVRAARPVHLAAAAPMRDIAVNPSLAQPEPAAGSTPAVADVASSPAGDDGIGSPAAGGTGSATADAGVADAANSGTVGVSIPATTGGRPATVTPPAQTETAGAVTVTTPPAVAATAPADPATAPADPAVPVASIAGSRAATTPIAPAGSTGATSVPSSSTGAAASGSQLASAAAATAAG